MSSGISQYQNVFRVSKSGTNGQVAKRSRQVVSCLPCRNRKLKCDRQEPCASCLKRDDAPSCVYASASGKTRDRDGNAGTSEAQLRLQKLESMVTQLIQDKQNGVSSRVEETSRRDAVNGDLDGQALTSRHVLGETPSATYVDAESNFHGATHWRTILENIRGVQDALEYDEPPRDASSYSFDPILDTSQPLTLEAALEFLPSRSDSDKLVRIAFSARHVQIPFIHQGTFLKEYASFWENPSSTSFLWISILFSLLHVGARIDMLGARQLVNSSTIPPSASMIVKAGQALVTGQYRRAKRYSVEALLLYTTCKHMIKEDPEMDIWTLIGVAARIAMRMGYHRDPRHIPGISPFDGEMRRRTFVVIENLDLLLSFQAGLPSILHESECDSEVPRNLFDSDFDSECQQLPESRPITDLTPQLYYNTKNQFCKVFRRVIRYALAPTIPSFKETMKLDRQAYEGYNSVPPGLKYKPIPISYTDEAYVVVHRLNIEVLYQKTFCILHRSYLTYERYNPSFDYSRRVCVEAALRILEIQVELKDACSPGGQFYTNKWMLGNLTMHDFLLAAMIACLALWKSHICGNTSVDTPKTKQRLYDALRVAHEIWVSRVLFSSDARRASKVLAIMISKIPRPVAGSQSFDSTPASSNHANGSCSNAETGTEVSSGAFTADSSGFAACPDPTNGNGFGHIEIPGLDPEDPLQNMFNSRDDFDWGLLDQTLMEGSMTIGQPDFQRYLDESNDFDALAIDQELNNGTLGYTDQ